MMSTAYFQMTQQKENVCMCTDTDVEREKKAKVVKCKQLVSLDWEYLNIYHTILFKS